MRSTGFSIKGISSFLTSSNVGLFAIFIRAARISSSLVGSPVGSGSVRPNGDAMTILSTSAGLSIASFAATNEPSETPTKEARSIPSAAMKSLTC